MSIENLDEELRQKVRAEGDRVLGLLARSMLAQSVYARALAELSKSGDLRSICERRIGAKLIIANGGFGSVVAHMNEEYELTVSVEDSLEVL